MSSALGKGLSALLDTDEITVEENANLNDKYIYLPINDLKPGPYQPREYFDQARLNELAESIRQNGVIQPIVVRPTDRTGIYQIIAGERRWRACGIAGLKKVPVIVRTLTDVEALELALIENIQRQSLSPIEEAEGYRRLQLEFDYNHDQLAKMMGKSRSYITNLLRLLTLSDEIKRYIHEGKISMSHARALVSANSPEALAKSIIDKGLSVREAEKFAAGYNTRPKKGLEDRPESNKNTFKNPQNKSEDIISFENMLQEKLKLKVDIIQEEEGGKVVMHYRNLTELDKIFKSLGVI